MANRFATAFGGLAAAGRAVGLDDHQKMLADHRRRLHDGHVAAMAALGAEAGEMPEDDMGVQVTGDITNYITAPQATSGAAQKLLPYVLAAALAGGGGVAGALLTSYLASNGEQPVIVQQPENEVVDTDTDTQYELRISRGE